MTMTMKNADMPAMPIVDPDAGYPLDVSRYGDGLSSGKFTSGLTKREMMAMHILSGLLAATDMNNATPDQLTTASVRYADKLLSELHSTSK